MSFYKVDSVKKIKFILKYEKIKHTGKPVYCLDGCWLRHNSMLRYVWILKRARNTIAAILPEIDSILKRQLTYIPVISTVYE